MKHEVIPAGRREAPRLQLGLPAKLLAVHANHTCIIVDISRSGVRIAISDPLEIGEQGYLRCGPMDHFFFVTRKEKGLNGLQFELPLSEGFVTVMREFQENFAEHERAELLATAQTWISGALTDNTQN